MSLRSFTVAAEAPGSMARAGVLSLRHGEVQTPIFMPVATHGALRHQLLQPADELGFEILLANTYHLLLRPGPERMAQFGGLHNFMQWKRGLLTDSGGFQVFSLAKFLTMEEQGAVFTSYVDGSKVELTPERSIQVQRALGSDIMMQLDECIPSTSDEKRTLAALERTYRWGKRSLAAREGSTQGLFGIVQGACFEHLRRQSAELMTSLPFDGFAVGGLAVGEGRTEREDMTAVVASLLPTDKPRYLMGVGTPSDILEAVHRGIDMFDCILPTALGGQGLAYTRTGRVDLRRGAYRESQQPVDAACGCFVCKTYTRAYLHHLVKVGEEAGKHLIAHHNLRFYRDLVIDIRAAILNGTFLNYYHAIREILPAVDTENPTVPVKHKPKTNLQRGDYEVIEVTPQVGSIRQISSGEIMHSSEVPIEESKTLYVHQSALAARAVEPTEEPLIIWDVGLGAATNAMAAISEIEKVAKDMRRTVIIYSFENDLDPLTLAMKHKPLFSHLWHRAPEILLRERLWHPQDLPIVWHLLQGDFLERLHDAERPHIILYDPFSFKVDSPLWTLDTFKLLKRKTDGDDCMLFTYSSSTLVRAQMIVAGFTVAKGVSTGMKLETTVALNRNALERAKKIGIEILGKSFLERWERSDAQMPRDLTVAEQLEFKKRVRSAEQFA
jgi:queuine tRNA-ribosyltransferase